MTVSRGRSFPLGATVVEGGVNFLHLLQTRQRDRAWDDRGPVSARRAGSSHRRINAMNVSDARLWHPRLRINRVLRVMPHTCWSAEA